MSRPVIIIQARIGSSRLPGKTLLPLVNRPMLWHIVQRCRAVPGIAQVVVATTDQPQDQPIRAYCTAEGIAWYAGSEADVLDRYYQAAVSYEADPIVRVTGDNPCVMPDLITKVLRLLQSGRYDLVGVNTGAGATTGYRYPDGVDVEGLTGHTLWWLWRFAPRGQAREHVSPYAWNHPEYVRIARIVASSDYSDYRLTVDYEADYQVMQRIYNALWRKDSHFTLDDVIALLEKHPDIRAMNRQHIGEEGYEALWTTT